MQMQKLLEYNITYGVNINIFIQEKISVWYFVKQNDILHSWCRHFNIFMDCTKHPKEKLLDTQGRKKFLFIFCMWCIQTPKHFWSWAADLFLKIIFPDSRLPIRDKIGINVYSSYGSRDFLSKETIWGNAKVVAVVVDTTRSEYNFTVVRTSSNGYWMTIRNTATTCLSPSDSAQLDVYVA